VQNIVAHVLKRHRLKKLWHFFLLQQQQNIYTAVTTTSYCRQKVTRTLLMMYRAIRLVNVSRRLSTHILDMQNKRPMIEVHALIEKDLRKLMPQGVPNTKKTKFHICFKESMNLQSLVSELHRGIPALKPPYTLQYRLPVEVFSIINSYIPKIILYR
jgi:hypothetical protein